MKIGCRLVLILTLLAPPGCAMSVPGLSGSAIYGGEDQTGDYNVSSMLPDRPPDGTQSWRTFGTKLLAAGQNDLAEDAFIRSLRVEGMTASALNGAGIAAQRQGLLTEAARYFERAKQIDPESVAARNNLGVALFGLGQIPAAQRNFRVALELSGGTSEKTARNLAMTELALADVDPSEQSQAAAQAKLERIGPAAYKLAVSPEIVHDG